MLKMMMEEEQGNINLDDVEDEEDDIDNDDVED